MPGILYPRNIIWKTGAVCDSVADLQPLIRPLLHFRGVPLTRLNVPTPSREWVKLHPLSHQTLHVLSVGSVELLQ
jgi:hypothetical protein